MNAEDIIVALAIKHDGDWEKIMNALNQRESISLEEQERMNEEQDLEFYLSIAKNSDYKYVTCLSEGYPKIFLHEYMPPFVLFYYGDLSLIQNVGKNVSVVGSRECSEYGAYMARYITSGICNTFNIVSGMAIGIDTIAHETAIKNGGKTIAVLGGGINYCYPSSNRSLYETLKRDHLVISEYPGDVIPQPYFFPRRNRLIAMFSRGTIVAEAHERSGTLTTVMYTLQSNRLLLCVPYLATDHSECNRLIANGAYLIETPEQAIEVLQHEIHL